MHGEVSAPSNRGPRIGPADDQHPLMTVAEAARALRVSQMTIRRAIHEGTFEAVQIGRAYRVPRAYVTGLIDGTSATAEAVAR